MHPPIDPFDSGWITRPDGARIYWEASGNPEGRPALYLHGGPGGGLGPGGYRRRFDPERHLVVGLDQRGCGRSTPWAIDDLDGLDRLTTSAMIDDIEALREHLGITRWLLHGVSWGSTLALAYALSHRDRVTELVLTAVTTGGREEIDWITEGVGRVFPEAWARFAADVPAGVRVVEHYARRLRDARHARLGARLLPPRGRERPDAGARARGHPRGPHPRAAGHQRTGHHAVAAAPGMARQPAARRRVRGARRRAGDGAHVRGDRRVRHRRVARARTGDAPLLTPRRRARTPSDGGRPRGVTGRRAPLSLVRGRSRAGAR